MITLHPTMDRVAVIRDDSEKKTKGGIHLPYCAEKESDFGTVVAVGPGAFNQDGTRRPMGVKVNDRVMFSDYHMTSTGSKVVIVDEEDVLAIAKG